MKVGDQKRVRVSTLINCHRRFIHRPLYISGVRTRVQKAKPRWRKVKRAIGRQFQSPSIVFVCAVWSVPKFRILTFI
jgi:hypothetical protein